MNIPSIPAQQASELINEGSGNVLLDVRTQEEYDGELGHLSGAILIPVQELQSRIGELDPHHGKRILVYCRTGRRSRTAAEILNRHGHDAVNVEGGMVAWNELNLPGVEYRR